METATSAETPAESQSLASIYCPQHEWHKARSRFTNIHAKLTRQIVTKGSGPILGMESPPVATTKAGA